MSEKNTRLPSNVMQASLYLLIPGLLIPAGALLMVLLLPDRGHTEDVILVGVLLGLVFIVGSICIQRGASLYRDYDAEQKSQSQD